MPWAMTTDANGRYLLATLCSELALGTTLDRRQELADAARAMARRLADPDTVIRTLNLVCDPLQVPSTLNERMVDAKEARWSWRSSWGTPTCSSGPAPTAGWPQCKPVTSKWRVGASRPCAP